jgi:hypothetical protein
MVENSCIEFHALYIILDQPTSMYTDSRTCTYCTDYNGAQGPTQYQDVSDCIQWDEGDAVVPIDQTNAAFITTRVTISDQARVVWIFSEMIRI